MTELIQRLEIHHDEIALVGAPAAPLIDETLTELDRLTQLIEDIYDDIRRGRP